MKSRKIKYADRRHVRACIEQLQAIIDGLRSGTLDLKPGREDVQLTPGGWVDFQLRVEQLARRETLKLEMTWRPEALRASDAGPDSDLVNEPTSELPSSVASAPPSEPSVPASAVVAAGGTLDSAPINGAPIGESNGAQSNDADSNDASSSELDDELSGPLSTRSLDRLATAKYQRLYSAARSRDSEGHWHLDKDQLILELARAGVDPLTQQELYTLALLADAEERSISFSEQAIEALKEVSLQKAAAAR